MPTLQQLRYLVAIADTLHFHRAAERAHVTQPTLSGQLKELEAKLGVQLVERSRARVVLTPTGAQIAARARSVLRDVADISEIAKQGQRRFSGTIRVGVVQSLGSYLLPLVIPELHASHPNLKLYVREGLAADLLGRIDDGALDLLFFPLPAAGPDLRTVRLFREPLLVVTATDHPLAARTQVARDDLRGESILTLEPGHRLHAQVKQICADTGARLSLDYEATSLDTIRQMVAMGLGISLLPALYVRSEVTQNTLVTSRPLAGPVPFRSIGMVWRKTAPRNDELVELAQILRRILRANAPEVTVID
ncbi:hydrogen peroxide-inducible genes activator [Rhodophyticola porphyridii]|uniref:Hydrogen peroxide-inducible genes activator n=1 Tax=Rhodophyticola porphyridii TaxID=1852017 RepID=A0A3L9Y1A6_9RHOB|nr:hydrogen peroxide-inducible genes activator [Rhodophyticola porphyridii]RMA41185.1 hydrogen peroxide-inducible genes activator [Rhodophyticola porphyridii]